MGTTDYGFSLEFHVPSAESDQALPYKKTQVHKKMLSWILIFTPRGAILSDHQSSFLARKTKLS